MSAGPQPLPPPEMSAKTKEILAQVRRMVPPMLDRFHKGQLGRVGVIGGCEDYTGAPYFSAMASARLGCDMSHVICTPAAAAVIKTYSPNLMVHPLMRQTPSEGPKISNIAARADRVSEDVIAFLPRLHVLVVGPGLGRDPLMLATAARVVQAARAAGMPIVLDADALQLVCSDPSLVRGYRRAVLTPNVVEFGRLAKAVGSDGAGATTKEEELTAPELARRLGVTLVQKGAVDIITDGAHTLTSDLPGGRKRSGGQGDTLTGAIATFLAWRKAYADKLWTEDPKAGEPLSAAEMIRLAAFGGSSITRECSRLAFAKRGRSLQASDLTEEVHTAFLHLFGEDKEEDEEGAKL